MSNKPLSNLSLREQDLTGDDLMLVSQLTAAGWKSAQVTLEDFFVEMFKPTNNAGQLIQNIQNELTTLENRFNLHENPALNTTDPNYDPHAGFYLRQVTKLASNSGLAGDGRSSNPMSVNFPYLDTLYVNETDFTNYQDDVNTQINNINNSISQGIVTNSRNVNTGAGLVGGGNLSADRTISMGAPSSITSGSSNSASGDTHSHELAPGAVTNAKLANNSVTDEKIQSVSASKITGVIPSVNLPPASAPVNVIDNLTSNSVNDALSANQGRILDNRINVLSDISSFKIIDFDFVVVTFAWTQQAGRWFNTRTALKYGGVDNNGSLFNYDYLGTWIDPKQIGWNVGDTLSYQGETIALWAGNGQSGNGSQSILIYFNQLDLAFNNLTQSYPSKLFEFIFRGQWETNNERRDGTIIVQIETFKGDTGMDKVGSKFIPREGTKKISSQAFYVDTPLKNPAPFGTGFINGKWEIGGFELGRLQIDLHRNLFLFRSSDRNLVNTSIAQNGYTTLPSGLIMQWGRVDNVISNPDIYFPIIFPNSLLNLQLTADGTGGDSIGVVGYNWSLSNNTKFRFILQHSGILKYSYIALGY